MAWKGLMSEYASWLPNRGVTITLLEGNTPLVAAPALADALECPARVMLKVDGLNPTGSFKDRGMTVAISMAAANGSRAVVCASTGNTSASAAAYAARAGLPAYVIIPAGRVALGKLSQAVVHGATVLSIEANFDHALRIVRALGDIPGIALVNSVNPHRIEGQKTAAFEICDVLGRAPNFHILPVGNAGNITAYWKGYREYFDKKHTTTLPKMCGFQAAGAAPLVLGHPVTAPETVATAIRIGDPASGAGAIEARDQSGGLIDAVTDEEILSAYSLLAQSEGIFAEPASAASIAGLRALSRAGRFQKDDVVVCTLTGHGLKDPSTATAHSAAPRSCGATVAEVREALNL